jgi:patatin-like phospholipase/acyl hydrolase
MTTMDAPPRPADRFQILALDGGGIKGIFSAAVLAAVEEDLGTHIRDHFDLIAGTSTGGIIAIGLGLGFSPREILEFYLQEGGAIFANHFWTASLRRCIRPKFSSLALASALQKYFRDARFGDSQKRLVIPSYNLGEDDVYIFRTAHHERLRRDYKVAAWKVALSTSSAPTYFPVSREVDKLRLVDGGVWANNPAMVAVIEAHGTLGVPLSSLRVLSLGTCDEISDRKAQLDHGGLWQWRTAAIEVVLRGQSLGVCKHVKFLIGDSNFLRIDPAVPAGILRLDKPAHSNDLIGKAAHYSRNEMPRIRDLFANHRAAQFTPLYG